MKISKIVSKSNWILSIVSEDGRNGIFNLSPYLNCEAFEELKNREEFLKVHNRGYYIEWDCGVDLSADTIEARWQLSED